MNQTYVVMIYHTRIIKTKLNYIQRRRWRQIRWLPSGFQYRRVHRDLQVNHLSKIIRIGSYSDMFYAKLIGDE